MVKAMGSAIINQLTKKTTPSLRLMATTLKTSLLSDHSPTIFLENQKSDFTNNSNPPPTTADSAMAQNPTKPFNFYYPNFPFGFLLNPISATGFHQFWDIQADDGGENHGDDAKTMWADSVKKKRKKKMNKHKYKKLRKRQRRKT